MTVPRKEEGPHKTDGSGQALAAVGAVGAVGGPAQLFPKVSQQEDEEDWEPEANVVKSYVPWEACKGRKVIWNPQGTTRRERDEFYREEIKRFNNIDEEANKAKKDPAN